MSKEDPTLSQIKSGQGLPPLPSPQQNGNAGSSGTTQEQRGQNTSGLRTEQFGLKHNNERMRHA